MHDHALQVVNVRRLVFPLGPVVHVVRDELPEVERGRKGDVLRQLPPAPVETHEVDCENARGGLNRESLSGYLLLLADVTEVKVVAIQVFRLTELLDTSLKSVSVCDLETQQEKRL